MKSLIEESIALVEEFFNAFQGLIFTINLFLLNTLKRVLNSTIFPLMVEISNSSNLVLQVVATRSDSTCQLFFFFEQSMIRI